MARTLRSGVAVDVGPREAVVASGPVVAAPVVRVANRFAQQPTHMLVACPVQDVPTVAGLIDHAEHPELREVLRDRGPGDLEALGERGHVQGAAAEQPQEPETGGVGQHPEAVDGDGHPLGVGQLSPVLRICRFLAHRVIVSQQNQRSATLVQARAHVQRVRRGANLQGRRSREFAATCQRVSARTGQVAATWEPGEVAMC